ncbi:MAG TPA: nucleoside monophosphate kinase [Candidatus Saccharimonadales bacterium]
MIILFGVVGSGKSQQAERLIAKLHCPYLSTSKLIREKNNLQWDKLITAGHLLPDDDIFSLLEPELEKIDAANAEFILDGAPRSIGQAEWLIAKIKAGSLKFTAIIHLDVSKEVVLQRLLSRGRYDDKEEVIATRFEQYDKLTVPVLKYFQQQGYPVSEVDGSPPIGEVEKQIWELLKDKVEAKVR